MVLYLEKLREFLATGFFQFKTQCLWDGIWFGKGTDRVKSKEGEYQTKADFHAAESIKGRGFGQIGIPGKPLNQ